MFSHLPSYAGDPILTLVETFLKDECTEKVNLGIGVYADDDGHLPVLSSVKSALTELNKTFRPYNYLPMAGDASYLGSVADVLFGSALKDPSSVAMVQTLGGSGALKIGADFLHAFYPQSTVWMSDPTWDNHIGIFEGAGFQPQRYPYYDRNTNALAFPAMLAALKDMRENDIVLLHPCCHNPTGIDPDQEQWRQIIDVIEERKLLPFFDLAYQGFSRSLDDDVWPVREALRRDLDFVLSNSFSKIFSLYGERSGALTVHCHDKKQTANALGQMKQAVRRNYSSPPAHGALLVKTVLQNKALRAQWETEVAEMRTRIQSMRTLLHRSLQAALPKANFDYVVGQNGMFSYTGLSSQQVIALRDRHAVYALLSGRICIAGINSHNIEHVSRALVDVIQNA